MRKHNQGFTMMEILVTIVIVSFGLLGFAAMLTNAVQSNRMAFMRSEATVLAYGIIESMRANRPAAVAGSYTIAVGSASIGSTMAAQDLQAWKSDLSKLLPAGDGAVTVDGQGHATVTIQWDDNGDGVATSFTTQTTI
jgi:type IV pilus assembly protein PilV